MMEDYHKLHLKTDVLLLADIFEEFRNILCLEYYGLDPCHCFSSLWLRWNTILRMAGFKLDFISDIDMYQFIEKGMEDGVSFIV